MVVSQQWCCWKYTVPDRDVSALSPKVSLGYEPGPWKMRYSFGRAHRFPVIAELFQSLSSPTSILIANALLRPENGVHHNFMVEYALPKGYVRVNVFRDDIKDAIQQVQRASGHSHPEFIPEYRSDQYHRG